MSASHGHSTMGGIEYNEGGYVEKTKKEKIVSHQLGVSTGYGDAHLHHTKYSHHAQPR